MSLSGTAPGMSVWAVMGVFLILPAAVAGLAKLTGADAPLAYVDPGVGSYVFQLLIAGATALLFSLVCLKRRIQQWFGAARPGESPPSPGPGAEAPGPGMDPSAAMTNAKPDPPPSQ